MSWARLVSQSEAKQLTLLDYLLERSAAQLETEKVYILAKMDSMLQVMEEAVAFGMTGVTSNSGLTGGSAKKLKGYMETVQAGGNRPALLGPVAGSAVTYALAAAEANAAMGRIVAAPTAGASGILPGVLMSLKEHCGVSREKLVEGLVIAGVIGEVIASRASIAGATGGCQAECGSGAAMAAGAVVSQCRQRSAVPFGCGTGAGRRGQFHSGGRSNRCHGQSGTRASVRAAGNRGRRSGSDADGTSLDGKIF